jgi:hypothetical protein
MAAIVTGREFASGNIYVREMAFEHAGDHVNGHAHNFDHTTYCVRGALLIEHLDATDSSVVLASTTLRAGEPGAWALIKADALHRITALADGSLGHCIYAHRTPQGEVVQEYTGWHRGTC